MVLIEIIEYLEKLHSTTPIKIRLDEPHSWRGSYYELGVVYKYEPSTVGEFLDVLKSAHGKTYEGYKGEHFTMHDGVDVHLVTFEYEIESQPVSELLLKLMVF